MYAALYREVNTHCVGDAVLELGSGIGVSREFLPKVVTTDIVKTEYVDRAMSAYDIERPAEQPKWSSIFAIDLLHHLREPMRFFESASKQLATGGRIVLIEPAATFGGNLFYKCFHHEPIRIRRVQPPFVFEANGRDGEFANMAMAEGMIKRHSGEFIRALEQYDLSLKLVQYRDVFAYPLSGGYSKPQFLPTGCLKAFLLFESLLPQFVLRRVGLRILVVLEKRSS